MTPIVDEQAAAAVEHANVLLDRQFQASRCHPTDAIFQLPPDRMPGFAGTLNDRFLAELSRPDLLFCVHALRRQRQPLFYRTWVPSRLVCHQCRPPVISTPAGYPCLACGRSDPGRHLNVQTYQMAFVAFYFGLCQGCTDAMQADLAGHEG